MVALVVALVEGEEAEGEGEGEEDDDVADEKCASMECSVVHAQQTSLLSSLLPLLHWYLLRSSSFHSFHSPFEVLRKE